MRQIRQIYLCCFFFSSRRRHTRFDCDWSSDVCSSDLSWPGASKQRMWRSPRGPSSTSTSVLSPSSKAAPSRGRKVKPGGPCSCWGTRGRKRGGEGKRVDLGGRRIIKKKNRRRTSGERE